MDLELLLFLQNFREGAGACLADFLKQMTFLGELSTVLLAFAIIYWCFSRDFGTYLLMGWSWNRLVNGFLKITACVYRPWIRDPRIIPYGDSMTTATGYSFPSGHTTNGGSLFGGIVVRKDRPAALRFIAGIFMVLIGFSRLYLGVHTIQDVLVGLGCSLLIMWLSFRLMSWLEKNPEKDKMVVLAGLVLAVLLGLYAKLKPYPVAYDAEGKILVEGAKMANDTFKDIGYSVGFWIGWFLERRFVRFSTDISVPRRALRFTWGLLAFYAVNLILAPLVKEWIGGPIGTLFSCMVQTFFISFIFPWCMVHLEKK